MHRVSGMTTLDRLIFFLFSEVRWFIFFSSLTLTSDFHLVLYYKINSDVSAAVIKSERTDISEAETIQTVQFVFLHRGAVMESSFFFWMPL